MYTNTNNKRFPKKLYDYLKPPVFFTIAKIGLMMLLILITACSKNENSNINQDCPEVSLDIKEDVNDKTKITVQATSSITEGVIYKWKVIDKNGSQEINGDPNGSLSWQLKNKETKFCVTISTLDCTEGVEECITYSLSCEDNIEVIHSESRTVFSKVVFKDGYMYYAKQQLNLLNVSKLAIYKLNLSDKKATPIKILDVKDNVFGGVVDLVFKDDVLYVSVANHIIFSKVYKIDTSMTNPMLVEVLDLKFKNVISGMILKNNNMYSVSSFIGAKLFKSDVMKPILELKELTTFGKRSPHEEKTWTLDMTSKDNDLYILARSKENGHHIIKVDLNDSSLKSTIIISNMDESNRIELYEDDLYLLFRIKKNDDWTGNRIRKLNTMDSSPSLEKVSKDYSFKIHDFSFHKEFMYMSILDSSQDKYELVKVPVCSLK